VSKEEVDSDEEGGGGDDNESVKDAAENEVGSLMISRLTHQPAPPSPSSSLSSVYDEPPTKRRASGAAKGKGAKGKKKDPYEGVRLPSDTSRPR